MVADSGMKAANRSLIWAQASARAILVDPLEASITVLPSRMSPFRHAFSRMCRAIRSLVDPLGLRNSSLHQMDGEEASN